MFNLTGFFFSLALFHLSDFMYSYKDCGAYKHQNMSGKDTKHNNLSTLTFVICCLTVT